MKWVKRERAVDVRKSPAEGIGRLYRTVVRNLIFTLSEPLNTSDLQDQCFLMLSFIIE